MSDTDNGPDVLAESSFRNVNIKNNLLLQTNITDLFQSGFPNTSKMIVPTQNNDLLRLGGRVRSFTDAEVYWSVPRPPLLSFSVATDLQESNQSGEGNSTAKINVASHNELVEAMKKDYEAQLAKAKEDYEQSLTKLREDHEKQLADAGKAPDYRENAEAAMEILTHNEAVARAYERLAVQAIKRYKEKVKGEFQDCLHQIEKENKKWLSEFRSKNGQGGMPRNPVAIAKSNLNDPNFFDDSPPIINRNPAQGLQEPILRKGSTVHEILKGAGKLPNNVSAAKEHSGASPAKSTGGYQYRPGFVKAEDEDARGLPKSTPKGPKALIQAQSEVEKARTAPKRTAAVESGVAPDIEGVLERHPKRIRSSRGDI